MIRTSTTDPIRADWIRGYPVGITIAPGKRGPSVHSADAWDRDLGADLDRLRTLGTDVLVCLLEQREMVSLNIGGLLREAPARALRTLWMPIRDMSIPDDARALRMLLAEIGRAEDRGERVVVHCAGGLGRAGTVAGCYLVDRGMGVTEALSALREARGPRCPETLEQVAFIRAWAMRGRRARPGAGIMQGAR